MSRVPKLCRHKGTGRAYVTDPGTRKPVYLGKWGSAEAKESYGRWLMSYTARLQVIPSGTYPGQKVTMARLIYDYLEWAKTYYLKHGKLTGEISMIRQALKPIGDMFPLLLVDDFRPTHLKQIREHLVSRSLTRVYINCLLSRVKKMFSWAVEQELAQPETLGSLTAVRNIQRGRTAAREKPSIKPVDLETIQKTLEHLDLDTATMVRVHLLGCMRACEVTQMRGEDIESVGTIWIYTPWSHKTEHKGLSRKIWLNRRCQELLAPLLSLRPTGWLFPSSNHPGEAITTPGYRLRIAKACKRAKVSHWHPLQLRHTALTIVRATHGLEASQVLAGHAKADITQVYAERNDQLGQKAATELNLEGI